MKEPAHETQPEYTGTRSVVRGGLHFTCYDVAALDDAYLEIFEEEVYCFTPETEHPYIIDAGANLGLATCYFKTRYPAATVLAFEPDPRMGALYRRNIQDNGFDDVTFRPVALAGSVGVAHFYGDVAAKTPHALGNSLYDSWGEQRPDSTAIEVATERLSPYLNRDLDLLKMDIEGLEGEVLREIVPYLPRVREIRLEVHQTRARPCLADIEILLQNAGYNLHVEPRPLRELLPVAALPWFEREQPELFVLAASRR